jgi:hypothetical protein
MMLHSGNHKDNAGYQSYNSPNQTHIHFAPPLLKIDNRNLTESKINFYLFSNLDFRFSTIFCKAKKWWAGEDLYVFFGEAEACS